MMCVYIYTQFNIYSGRPNVANYWMDNMLHWDILFKDWIFGKHYNPMIIFQIQLSMNGGY